MFGPQFVALCGRLRKDNHNGASVSLGAGFGISHHFEFTLSVSYFQFEMPWQPHSPYVHHTPGKISGSGIHSVTTCQYQKNTLSLQKEWSFGPGLGTSPKSFLKYKIVLRSSQNLQNKNLLFFFKKKRICVCSNLGVTGEHFKHVGPLHSFPTKTIADFLRVSWFVPKLASTMVPIIIIMKLN